MSTRQLISMVRTTVRSKVRDALMKVGIVERPRLEMRRHPAGIVRERIYRRSSLPYRRRVRYTSLQKLLS